LIVSVYLEFKPNMGVGEGGALMPSQAVMAGLRALADKHGILLIADEVRLRLAG
jgi:acetylornithine/succinyldiaminopimelate/putrescine aminotransferase